MTIKEYTEEFFKLSIRAGKIQGDIERVGMYINGLRDEIQYESILLNLKIVEDAYQVASRVEERLLKNRTRRIKGEVQQEEKGLQTKEVSFRLLKMR